MSWRERLRQHAFGDAQDVQELPVPSEVCYVEHHRAGRVGVVRGMGRPARQVPYEPRLDGAEQDASCLGTLSGPWDAVEYPAQLGPREVRVYLPPRLGEDRSAESAVAELLAELMGPAVLPHDGVAQRPACDRIPHDSGLPLVRDPHGHAFGGIDPRPRQAVADGLPAELPYLVCIVLHHARTRIDLPEVPLGDGEYLPAVTEQHAADAGGPRVDGHNVPWHVINRGRCRPGSAG